MATKRKASWLSKNVQDNIPFHSHRRMDLRNIEEFNKFRATKYVFSMTGDQKFSITAHKNTPEVLKEEMIMELDRLIVESMESVRDLGCPLNCIIHFYLHCEGLDHDFVWNGIGRHLKTLRQMLDRNLITEITGKFMMMIQSGREVDLNDRTRLTIMAFNPPPELRQRVDELSNSSINTTYL